MSVDADAIRIEFPWPPALSSCFTHRVVWSKKQNRWVSTEVATDVYKEWQRQALKMIALQAPGNLRGEEVEVRWRLVPPDRRERDAGNLDKALMDMLVRASIITNDSNRYVRRLNWAWEDEGCPCVCFIQRHHRKDRLAL